MENAPERDALLAEFETTLQQVDALIAKTEAEIKAKSELPAVSDPGRKNYEDTLGKALGGALYDEVSKALDKDTLSEQAEEFIDKNIKALSDRLKEMDGVDDDAADAIDKLAEVLADEFGTLASDFIKGEGAHLLTAVQDVVDENPLLVATMALVAAALAVILNMEVPELKAKFKLSDKLAVEVGANLGKLQEITLERLQTRITLEIGKVKASAGVVHTPEDTSSRLDISYKPSDAFSADSYLAHSIREGLSGGAKLRLKPTPELSIGARLDISELDGASGGMDMRLKPTDEFSIGTRLDLSERDGASLGMDMRLNPRSDLSIGARVDLSERDGASGGMDLKYSPTKDLTITGGVDISESKGIEAAIGAEYKPNDRTTIDLKVTGNEGGGAIMGGVKVNF